MVKKSGLVEGRMMEKACTKCVSVVRKKKEEDDDDGDIIVASGGADGIVRIWIVDSENIRLKMLCRLDNGVAPISCVSLKYYTSSSSPLSFESFRWIEQ